MSSVKKKLIIVIAASIAIICLLYPFIRTESVSGKLLLVGGANGLFDNSKTIKFRTDDGRFLNLSLYDDDLFFDDKPNLLTVTCNNKTLEVGLDKFINEICNGQENVPSGGVTTQISYNPNVIKHIWFIKRNDGFVKKINCNIPEDNSVNQKLFQMSEVSRTDGDTYKIKYSYTYKGQIQNAWYLIDGENGQVTSYTKQGDRFLQESLYNDTPVIKFKEELIKDTSTLINITQHPEGTFEVCFPDKEKMLNNSYLIEQSLNELFKEEQDDL